jgi:opacity protein-like surface antigen
LVLVAGINFGDDNADYTGTTYDLYGGYRHTFFASTSIFHPYISAGLALVRARLKIQEEGSDAVSEDDISPGGYVRAGIAVDLHKNVRLGADYRRVFLTDSEIGPTHSADFGQYMLSLGIGF